MPDVSLFLNYPLSEALNKPWSVFKTAHGMAFSWPQSGVYFNTGNALPEYVWQEPNTGIIIIKPAFFSAKMLTYALDYPFVIPASQINYGSTAAGGNLFAATGSTANNATTLGSSYQLMKPTLSNPTDVRQGLLAIDSRLTSFIARSDYSAQNMIWSMQTQVQYQANQGWSLLITPAGISADFANTYVMVAFGQKLIMEITMAGIAYMWGDVDGLGTYVLIDTYVLKDGGVNLTQAFQVSVIPLAKRFLAVTFTQHAAPTSRGRASTYASKPDSFLTVLRGTGPDPSNPRNLEPYWDPALFQWVKYPAAPLTLGLVSNDFDYSFVIAQAWYPDVETVFMAREFPPERSTWNGTSGITPYLLATTGQTEAGGGAPASVGYTAFDIHGNPYVASVDTGLISAVTLGPSATGIYTPELHGLGVSYPANVQTPPFTPIDVSDKWKLIRFVLTTDLSPQRVELKLLRDDDWFGLMKMAGPCLLAIDNNSGVSQIISEFYAERQQPTVSGPALLIVDQFEGQDAWQRLDHSPLLMEKVIEGTLIATAISQAIQDAGFGPSEIWIDYAASPELATLTFGLFVDSSDLLRPNTDSTCGDFIRNTAEKLGVQFSPPLRVRRVTNGSGNRVWRIYLGPIYATVTTYVHGAVQNRFFLDDSLMSVATYGTQQARYQARDFVVTSADEWTVLRPKFNAVEGSCVGYISKPEAHERRIGPPSRVLTDPSYIGFEGAERIEVISVEKLQIAQNGQANEAILRQYYEQNYNLKRLRHRECAGEWQPEIDADQFFALIGRAKFDNPAMGYSAGDPISYGAFRIEHIDTEIRQDFDDPVSGLNTMRYEWAGSYTATYVGPYSDSGFTIDGVVTPLVMWTVPADLPDNYDIP